MRALVLVALAGCFDPAPEPGQACTDWCPPPEQCVAKVCRMIDEGARANYAFVTDDDRSIVEQTPNSLDAWCNERAAAANMAGEYVAWFSTEVSAAQRFGGLGARGWIRPDGQPFADSVADILAGKLYNPLRISDAGTDAQARLDINVATGTEANGQRTADTCNNLTPGMATALVTVGKADAGLQSWTHVGATSCGRAHIYCFGTDRSVTVPTPAIPPGAKRAFITRNPYTLRNPNDATLLCRTEGGPTFVALVATAEQSIAEQFAGVTGPWFRPDGVMVTADMMDLVAPIELTSDGKVRLRKETWFGAVSLRERAIADHSCDFWANPGGSVRTGASERSVGKAPFATQSGNCGGEYHYYCAER